MSLFLCMSLFLGILIQWMTIGPNSMKITQNRKLQKQTQPRACGTREETGKKKLICMAFNTEFLDRNWLIREKMSDFYEDETRTCLPTDIVQVNVTESFKCKKKAAQEILEGHRSTWVSSFDWFFSHYYRHIKACGIIRLQGRVGMVSKS